MVKIKEMEQFIAERNESMTSINVQPDPCMISTCQHMSNRSVDQITTTVNDDGDGVSCVTSSSRMTLETETETETLSNTELELLQLPVLLYQLFNNGDTVQIRQLLTKYFTQDCLYQSPTMDAPTHGIEHIMATVEGVIQNVPDFMLSATNIRWIERVVVSETVVSPRCILFDTNFVGKL